MPKLLDYNHFFNYTYNPKLKEILPEYDKRPLVYFLDIGQTTSLGINLHWIPFMMRFKFTNFLIGLNKKGLMTRKKYKRIVYTVMKNNPALRPALQGIRRYYNNRMSNIRILDIKDMKNFKQVSIKYPARKVKNPNVK